MSRTPGVTGESEGTLSAAMGSNLKPLAQPLASGSTTPGPLLSMTSYSYVASASGRSSD
jgi:hypothetical protein